MYTLAVHTEYIAPLCEEIEGVLAKEELSKTALLGVVGLDSFLRESTRLTTFNGSK
jgi:hypothetical protein